jgi:methylthioribulose-1-phosphate dehydratase
VERDSPNIARALAELCHRSHARGWALGTSGNFSAVISRRPFRLAITASACNKRALSPADIVTVNERGELVGRRPVRAARASERRPSAETLLHLAIARERDAGAVVHTHSVWSTMMSDLHASAGGLGIGGYEMLKGLQGVTSHQHREWIPILENDQDMARLARGVRDILAQHEDAHAVLLRRHGLYTWGDTLGDAERHLEILEFLFETLGRTRTVADTTPDGGMQWRS